MHKWKSFSKLFILTTAFIFLMALLSMHAKPAATAPYQSGDWVSRINSNFGSQQRIAMSDETSGWMFHYDYTINPNNVFIYKYENYNWSGVVMLVHSQRIVEADIEMISADDGWLVLGGWLGDPAAESVIYRWDGSNWVKITMITDPNGIALSSLDVLNTNSVWALGTGNFWSSLYRWDGSSWSYAGKSPGGVWPSLDLDMLTETDGWAVGLDGAIARWDGTSLVEVASPATSHLNAVSMVNSSSGWAVGDAGTILKWNGVAWTTYASPTTADLKKVQMLSADEGWIIGANVVLHWDGTQWNQATMPVTDSFHDIDMISASEGWLMGNSHLLQYVVPEPKLTMNYTSGAPGSYFNILGQYFPANSTATLSVNGRTVGTVPVSSGGTFAFTLTTTNADEGTYFVTASVNPTATKQFVLDATEPVRPEDLPADTFDVPAGIAFTESLYLPTIIR
ncbi:MAG: hypothetical protein WAS33_17965 [Candidatus Promineifilaceae bacterium]